jgi:hypothetical protein
VPEFLSDAWLVALDEAARRAPPVADVAPFVIEQVVSEADGTESTYHLVFTATEIRYLNEPADRLTEPDDPVIAANVRRLNELLFAPLDYALVARTAGDA